MAYTFVYVIFFTIFAAKFRYDDQRRTDIAIKGHRVG